MRSMHVAVVAYLGRHVGGGGLQLQETLRDDLWALLTCHELL